MHTIPLFLLCDWDFFVPPFMPLSLFSSLCLSLPLSWVSFFVFWSVHFWFLLSLESLAQLWLLLKHAYSSFLQPHYITYHFMYSIFFCFLCFSALWSSPKSMRKYIFIHITLKIPPLKYAQMSLCFFFFLTSFLSGEVCFTFFRYGDVCKMGRGGAVG